MDCAASFLVAVFFMGCLDFVNNVEHEYVGSLGRRMTDDSVFDERLLQMERKSLWS